MSANNQPCERSQPTGAACTADMFCYNPVLVPQYATPILETIFATLLVEAVSQTSPFETFDNPHLPTAVAGFILLSVGGIWLTFRNAMRCPSVAFTAEAIDLSRCGRSWRAANVTDVAALHERAGRFFGRPCIELLATTQGGPVLLATDFISHYDVLRKRLEKITGRPVAPAEPNAHADALLRARRRREVNLSSRGWGYAVWLWIFGGTSATTLATVGMVYLIWWGLISPLEKSGPTTVYAPLGILAAMIATSRFVWFPLFSAPWMHRMTQAGVSVGFGPRR